jgi:transcriptional regulator with XRE-family HTH domain
MNGYGDRLSLAIKQKGMKQMDLAQELGITRTAISKIIHGTQYMDLDLALRACKILDISLEWLAYGDHAAPNAVYHKNPNRQRIEYLVSILTEAEYPLVIAAMENAIEIRLHSKKKPPVQWRPPPHSALV